MKPYHILFALLLFTIFSLPATAQNWDYDKYPRLDVELNHMDAEIRIGEDGFIEGDVLYNANIKSATTDSLAMHASGMNIISVSVNDELADFKMQDNQLIINFSETYARGDVLSIRVQYNTNPNFGLHKSNRQTYWTSMLPKSTRHWLPVIDHPRIQFTTEIVFTHPTGKTMVLPGRQGGSELMSVDEESTAFTSSRPIPVTALGWAVGEFELLGSGALSGGGSGSRLYLYSEAGSAQQDLFETAVGAFQSISSEIGMRYPFTDLHIVILEENHWETKNYGAGIIFVFKNQGSLEQQIQQGILSQWFGAAFREEQWSDADAVNVLKAYYANLLFDFNPVAEQEAEPYHYFSGNHLSGWQTFLDTEDTGYLQEDLALFVSRLNPDDTGGILSWDTLAENIYRETGQPYFDGFTPADIEDIETTQFEYIARVEWPEGSNTAEIHFEAIGNPAEELVTVTVTEITFTGARSHEITFSGSSDGVVINVSPGVENVKLKVEDRDDILLHTEKPYLFWVYQLRNDEDESKRAEAARGLAGYTDNPDLQLALNDMFQMETNPEVYAEILRAISKLTAGASGTEEQFIQRSSPQEPAQVQLASVEALAYFGGNERVINHLRGIIIRTNNPEIRTEAIRSLYEITDTGRFRAQVQDLVTRESVLANVPQILRLLSEKGDPETAVEIAATFISGEFSFETRKGVLEMLLQYDESPANWNNRLPELLTDNHPVIRYMAAGALPKVSSQQRQAIIRQRIDDEYDERVRRRLR